MIENLGFLKPDDPRWMTYLSKNPQSNVFHHPAWSHLLAECYAYEPFVLAATNARGEIQAAIPIIKIRSLLNKQRLVSLPFTDHCSPLFSDLSTCKHLTDKLLTLSKRGEVSKIDLRSDYPTLPKDCRYSNYVLHKLRLSPDETEVSSRIKPKHFRQVRVAEQRGVRIKKGVDDNFIRQFYYLHTLTRRRKGLPVQPWRFFKLLVKNLSQEGLGFVLLAYKDQECVAGAVFLNWNKTLTYKYSATLEKARQLLAMDLLLWTAIQWGCSNGYRWMDMGRTNNDDEGLKYFKRRWGAVETPLDYCIISKNFRKPTTGPWLKRMQPVIQRSPIWFCRAAGELLYQHFG